MTAIKQATVKQPPLYGCTGCYETQSFQAGYLAVHEGECWCSACWYDYKELETGIDYHDLPEFEPLEEHKVERVEAAQDEQYPPCDFCGVIPDHHPWHGSGMFKGIDSPHIHACNDCRHLLPSHTVQGELVAWVTARTVDGQTVNGKPRRIWWENNEGVGMPIYTAPQPVVQGEPDQAHLRERFDEIEREIAENKHTASSVFTQMRTAAFYTTPQSAVQREPVAYLRKDQLVHVRRMGPMLGEIADSYRADRVPVYAAPQPAEQQPISHDWDDQDKCRRCGDRDWYASATCTPKQQPAPDVSALVEALEEISDPIRFMEERLEEGEVLNGMAAVQFANDAQYLRDIARKAIEAYRKGGES